ncbi:MAG: N-acyl homoserine lactonase family protein, partial [Pseudomonadota bacterium]
LYGEIGALTVDETVEEQLALIGLSPADIDYVSVSHSHFDHTGQPEAAGNATWLVHAREYQAMFADPQTAQSYAGFAGFDRQEFTGDYDVFGDGSVMILEMPGHTPGHTALQIMLPDNGPVLLTGDLYHRKESRALKRVPRFNTDEAKTRQSMVRFEQLAETLDAFVIIQHEPDDVDQLPTVPDALN